MGQSLVRKKLSLIPPSLAVVMQDDLESVVVSHSSMLPGLDLVVVVIVAVVGEIGHQSVISATQAVIVAVEVALVNHL